MNIFDLVVLAVVGILILRGLWKGTARQIIGLVGIAAGYVIAARLSPLLASKLLRSLHPSTGYILSFLAIFVACIIAAHIVGRLTVTGRPGVLSRIGGGLLGGMRGCVLFAVVTMMLIAFLPPHNAMLNGSRTVRYLKPAAGMISKIAPKNIRTKYGEKATKVGHPNVEER